jgi:hypothetical protein
VGPVIRHPRPARKPACRLVLLAVVACLFGLVPGSASAQPLWVRAAEPQTSPVQPILRIAAEQRYDDDVLLTQGENAPGAHLTKIMPQVGLKISQPTTRFEGFYGADFLFRDAGGEVIIDHRAALLLQTRLSRTAEVDGAAQFWDTSDPLALPRQGLARTLARTIYGRAELGWRQTFAPRWSFVLGYRFEGAKVDEPDHPPGFLNSPAIAVEHRLTRRADIGADYRLQLFKFGSNNAVANSPGVLWRYRLSRSATIRLAAGVAFYSEHQDPQKNGVVPRFEIGVTQRITSRVDWIFLAGHDLVGASGFNTAVWADFATLTIGWQVLQKLRLFGYGSFFRNGPMPNVGVFPLGWNHDGVAAGYGAGGGAEWRFNRHLAVQASYDRIDQVGGLDTGQPTLTRNIVAARLTVDAF